jgi:hypothetical protein
MQFIFETYKQVLHWMLIRIDKILTPFQSFVVGGRKLVFQDGHIAHILNGTLKIIIIRRA